MRLAATCLLWLLLAACVPGSFDDPLATMLDRDADPTHRLAAATQAQQQSSDDPARIAALYDLLLHVGHPVPLRIEAFDQLVADDDQALRRNLAGNLVRVQDWQVLGHIFATAIDRQWHDLTPTLVRHYALPAYGLTDQQRPERHAIARLNPGKSVEQVVFDVFANADDTVPMTHQVAAWHLLSRLHDRAHLEALLAQAPPTTLLVVDLQAAAADLHALPTNREGILWLSHLREPSQRDYWQAAAARVAQLTPEQRRDLELRHLGPLLLTDKRTLDASRAELVARLGRLTAGAKRHGTTPDAAGATTLAPPTFSAAVARLCWADLVTLDLLWRAVHTPTITRALFRQAEADRLDTGSEHGGVLAGGPEGWRVTPYQPELRRHDRQFVPPDEMIVQLYTAALAHYHFHAQAHRNTDYARPGRGDLKLADRLRFNFLVFTFVDRDQLNIDYHQPDGVVIDLGTIRR